MGNRSSRQRDRAQDPPAAPAQPQAQPLPPNVAYQPSPVYRQQVPYYPQQPYLNNGQYYGGWRPPHAPPQLPYPPQQPPGLPGPPAAVPPHHPHAPFPVPPPPQQQQPQQPMQQQPSQELTQTATIRNAVNLKKNTLRALPMEGDPSKLAISFLFDASAPCCVTTFVMASEEPSKGCKLTPAKQAAPPAVFYDKGLGLQFPPAGTSAEVAAQHAIDLSLYSEASLLCRDREGFPLVIRLETVAEKGLKDGHTLQELTPGAEQKVWVQSQTTFAMLHKEEDGSYDVRVIKQKIWVDGVSYELQEIYGLEQAGSKPEAATSPEDAEERLCVICLVNDRDTTVLPCRHMCMCHECAQELRKQTSKCPICRNHVESLLHIKMHKGQKPGQQQGAAAAAGSGSAAAAVATA